MPLFLGVPCIFPCYLVETFSIWTACTTIFSRMPVALDGGSAKGGGPPERRRAPPGGCLTPGL